VPGGTAIAFWAALGFAVAFEFATAGAAAVEALVAAAGAFASGAVRWAAPVAPAAPLLRRAENFAAG
jgi:hypothetical protein